MSIDWTATGTWFSGLATLIAVGFAFWLQRRSERANRPSLHVTLDARGSDCLRYVPPVFASAVDQPRSEGTVQREELWLRIKVETTTGATPRDVEARLIDTTRHPDVEPESRPNLWFKTSNLDATSVKAIPRGMWQYFDIAFAEHIVSPKDDLKFHLMIVRPNLSPWQTEKQRIEHDEQGNQLLVGWSYRIHIAVTSSNADAVHIVLRVKLNPRRQGDPSAGALFGPAKLRELLDVDVEKVSKLGAPASEQPRLPPAGADDEPS